MKPLQDARVAASLGILVGKTERVDMAFTRANGVARLLGNAVVSKKFLRTRKIYHGDA